MTVTVSVEHPEWRTRRAHLTALMRNAYREALAHEHMSLRSHGAGVLLTDDAELKRLNYEFRGKNKPTNVLAFPEGTDGYLGDIAISLDAVEREATEQGKVFAHHLMHLVVHGVLHLLGYDHEQNKDAVRMERCEVAILQQLGIANPYR